MATEPDSTEDEAYASRLVKKQRVWWKRLIDVQAPYRWNLNRLHPGFALDIGCGIGRNLANLRGLAVGIDHNASSVRSARERGFTAFTVDEFLSSKYATPRSFDSLLLSHVVEHMTRDDARALLRQYAPYVRGGGNLIFETPQEVGYRSDKSHVEFVDFEAIAELCRELDAEVVHQGSFPFPRAFGRLFIYNEFVVAARLPD